MSLPYRRSNPSASLRTTAPPTSIADDLPYVRLLANGEQAYPAMLSAIRCASSHLYVGMYHFDADSTGVQFLNGLIEAKSRGVDVRVLLDWAGSLISRPSIWPFLRRAGIPTIMYSKPSFGILKLNRRYHRKILVVDSRVAFLGGMNIRNCHLTRERFTDGDPPTEDIMVEIKSRSVGHQMAQLFKADWRHTSGELLRGDWTDGSQPDRSPNLRCFGTGGYRLDGIPEQSFEGILLEHIDAARESIVIVTPYFIPTQLVMGAIEAAAQRIPVTLIVPRKVSRYIQGPSWRLQEQLLSRGGMVFETGPPFDHTKILLLDSNECILGTHNWDGRSLLWNAEVGLATSISSLVAAVHGLVQDKLARAKRVHPPLLRKRRRKLGIGPRCANLLRRYL